ncbi:MAG: cytochrome c [Desulfobulbaceae bacterium]|nr:cytochrome c [Desulfobulbaceae bacterium]
MKTRRKQCVYHLSAIAAAILFIGSSCTSVPDGNPDNGERWYRMNRCNGCHGEKGKGGKAPAIAGLSFSYRQFIRKIRKPDSAIMPAFSSNLLSDADAADIYLWLQDQ